MSVKVCFEELKDSFFGLAGISETSIKHGTGGKCISHLDHWHLP